MGLIGGAVAYHLLRRLGRRDADAAEQSAHHGRSRLEAVMGKDVWWEVRGKSVIEIGCGTGEDAIEVARHGAARVVGIDIRESVLRQARQRAQLNGVSDRCEFATTINGRADLIISIDAFEHFDDPAAVLESMARHLEPGGAVLVVFGPPWFHPYGGHLFSVFPWAHLTFTEEALVRWRSDFKSDGARRFREVEGGLNQMTIGRFLRLVSRSPFVMASFEAIPIRRLRPLHNRLTRELFTAVVRCRLVLR